MNTYSDYNYYGGGHKGGSFKACYHTHPALVLPGTDLVIYGGNCDTPIVKDADVYIGFQSGMSIRPDKMPWETIPTQVLFTIPDMGVPADAEAFKKLVEWTKEKVLAGAKVHAGCIGGHGRTGMFFSALVSLFGVSDATTYVRKHYCQKAVESAVQVDFLNVHFGVTKVNGTKSYGGSKGGVGKSVSHGATFPGEHFSPLMQNGSIFGRG